MFPVVLLLAFILGYIPALGERIVLTFWRRGYIKLTASEIFKNCQSVPLELIQGIDAEIRARLEDHNLFDVQNLANANPIILFVETPYGIYQSLDWVAQAQLATGVGHLKFVKLQQGGVRTIFDLACLFGFVSSDFENALDPVSYTHLRAHET